jgi:cytochrome oxidase Cu insertion factor (SCO1/SenC/PrrC family)
MRRVQELAGDRLHLLSVTLDPERDTPAALRRFALARGADLRSWTFATGEPALVTDALPSLFNVLSVPRGGEISHSVKVALLAPGLVPVAEWKDGAIVPEQIVQTLDQLLATAVQPAAPR